MLSDLEKYSAMAQVSQGFSDKFPREQKNRERPAMFCLSIAEYGQELRVTEP